LTWLLLYFIAAQNEKAKARAARQRRPTELRMLGGAEPPLRPNISLTSEMKAKIIVTPKKAVVDPQGKTVQNALEHMGYKGIGAVHVGKYLEIELPGTDQEAWRRQIDEACQKILSNPVIEDYRLEIE
jgi:phosphoribosylformylglycinamidine synthase